MKVRITLMATRCKSIATSGEYIWYLLFIALEGNTAAFEFVMRGRRWR